MYYSQWIKEELQIRINFYRKEKEEKILILSKEMSLDEIPVYIEVLKREKIDKEINEDDILDKYFITKYEDNLVGDEVVRNVIMEYKEAKRLEQKEDARLWF